MTLGFVEDGKWALNSTQIVVNKKKKEFGVFKVAAARPRADLVKYLVGKKYFSNGTTQSGVFNYKTRVLEVATNLDLPAQDGFLGMGTKMTENQRCGVKIDDVDGYFYCGELNAAGQEHGRGILIHSSGHIWIN